MFANVRSDGRRNRGVVGCVGFRRLRPRWRDAKKGIDWSKSPAQSRQDSRLVRRQAGEILFCHRFQRCANHRMIRRRQPLRAAPNSLYGAHPTNRRLRRTVTCARGFSRPLRDRVRTGARAARIGEGAGQALHDSAPAEAGELNCGARICARSAQRREAHGHQSDRRTAQDNERAQDQLSGASARSSATSTKSREMPNLIEVQRESYEQFLRSDPKTGYVSGLEKTLRSVFPIVDFAGTAHLDFDHYELEHPKYDTDECRQRGLTYAAPMRVTLRLTTFEIDPETEAKSVIDIKEQDVYMGDMPLMTMNGTFIINGTERVIVSQMHRSPGVLFDHDRGKTHASGKYPLRRARHPLSRQLARLRVRRQGHRQRPHRPQAQAAGHGAAPRARHDRARKSSTPSTTASSTRAARTAGRSPIRAEAWRGQKPTHDVVDADSGEIIFKAEREDHSAPRQPGGQGRPQERHHPDRGNLRPLFGLRPHQREDRRDLHRGRRRGQRREPRRSSTRPGVNKLELLDIDYVNTGPWIRNTLKADKSEDGDSALADIYRVMRPGEPPTRETADALFYGLFFDPERYDLSAVGRVKLNMRLGLDVEDTVTTLRKEDILAVVQELVNLKDGKGEIDDIDNLANRRVRSVGELLENQYRVGLLRMERAVKERMSQRRRVDGHAERPDQRQAGGRRGARVLRLVAAVAVHGPDQPAVGSHPQAPRLGARARAASPASARASKSATSTRPTTAGSARSRLRKARTSASSTRSPASAGSTSTASSRRRTARSSTAR